ncbi:hypothetical protein DPMN_084085 [Dreissena polymorpha]|uniref:Uncharacterized protein n=1 Tax=Dreissena polymorpha TaxID=45954 RepID=A0A9D4BJ22_DREPO|nr:hypothetical protein DPMN_084085 [Dreissena polymorpha]
MGQDTKVPDGRPAGRKDGRTDNAKTISLRQWRVITKARLMVNAFTALQGPDVGKLYCASVYVD